MALNLRYKNLPAKAGAFLFVAGPADTRLFATNDFNALPALLEPSYADFLSSYNNLVAALWRLNAQNPAFGFLPFSLRNTWQSSYYQGAESYARLTALKEGVVYFTSPHWFLWAAEKCVAEVSFEDVARARKDARLSLWRRFVGRLRGIHFALSHYSPACNLPQNIKTCFFSIWTKAGLQKRMTDSSDPFYAHLPDSIPGAALVYHLEDAMVPEYYKVPAYPVMRDGSLLKVRDWVLLVLRILSFCPHVPHAVAAPRGAILDDIAATVSNQLVLSLISYYAARNIAVAHPGVKFVLLYEGNCWEQGVLRAAAERNLPVAALQHTAFSPGMLKMRGDTQGFVPAHIITSGPVATDLLTRTMGHKPESLITGVRVRHDGLPEAGNVSHDRHQILVLLQGSPYDALLLSQLSKVALPYEVVIRCHPSQPFDAALNFKRAQGSLAENLKDALLVLYNGTTAAFDALLSGVPCIYVSSGDHGRHDPLFVLDNPVKRSCSDIAILPALIESIVTLSSEARHDAMASARLYIEGYFQMPDSDNHATLVKYLQND